MYTSNTNKHSNTVAKVQSLIKTRVLALSCTIAPLCSTINKYKHKHAKKLTITKSYEKWPSSAEWRKAWLHFHFRYLRLAAAEEGENLQNVERY